MVIRKLNRNIGYAIEASTSDELELIEKEIAILREKYKRNLSKAYLGANQLHQYTLKHTKG